MIFVVARRADRHHGRGDGAACPAGAAAGRTDSAGERKTPERSKATVSAGEEIRGLRARARETSLNAVGGSGPVTFRGEPLVFQWQIRRGEPGIEVASRY